MSFARYLSAVTTTLRQTVLPEVQTATAADALNNAIRALAGIAASLERVPPEVLRSINLDALPAELQHSVPAMTDAAVALTLPLSDPGEDFAINNDALPLLTAGASWLATRPWPSDPGLLQPARALLKWETAMRTDAMRRANDVERGAVATPQGTRVADISQPALEGYLRKRPGLNEIRVTEFRFLSGGRNRQTALFRVAGTAAIPEQLVIQRESPIAMTTLSGISMQYAVLQQAHLAGVKVPRPLILELSADALGAPFMITERVRGTSPVPSMDYWGSPPKSDKLAASLAEQFARVHRIPLTHLESVMDRYVDERKGQTWLSDINTLETQWQSLALGPSMAVSAALAWMRTHVGCVDAVEAVVHNDALLQNVLAENEEITAVLDWEMAHIGHPFEDLGYVRPVVEQMTDWPRFIDAYTAAGGRRPSQEQIDFFTLRSILKLAIQVLYVRNAFNSGKANIPALAEIGASFLPRLIERLATQLNGILR